MHTQHTCTYIHMHMFTHTCTVHVHTHTYIHINRKYTEKSHLKLSVLVDFSIITPTIYCTTSPHTKRASLCPSPPPDTEWATLSSLPLVPYTSTSEERETLDLRHTSPDRVHGQLHHCSLPPCTSDTLHFEITARDH